MAMTPEGIVKKKIDAILKAAEFCLFDKPVVGPFGNTLLDYTGCSRGRHFEIEAKRLGEKPTERQKHRIERVFAAGGTAFVIDGSEEGLESLRNWLQAG